MRNIGGTPLVDSIGFRFHFDKKPFDPPASDVLVKFHRKLKVLFIHHTLFKSFGGEEEETET